MLLLTGTRTKVNDKRSALASAHFIFTTKTPNARGEFQDDLAQIAPTSSTFMSEDSKLIAAKFVATDPVREEVATITQLRARC